MQRQVFKGDRVSLEKRTLESILKGDYATSDRLMQSLNTRANLKIVSDQNISVPLHEQVTPRQSD